MNIRRREFLSHGALALGGAAALSRVAFAWGTEQLPSRFVFIILRGALDGLAAVPPYGDPDYARLRRDLALGGALRLDGTFGLHPSLAFLHESFNAREAIVFHAVASPYRERSHFDGQDVLESGFTSAHASQSGWLNRAIAALPSQGRAAGELGVALGQNIPLVMRGPAPVGSWAPSKLAALDEDTLSRLTDLYSNDALLSRRLADGLAADALSGSDESDGSMLAAATRSDDERKQGGKRYLETVRMAAAFLKREDGPRFAVFDTTGWDTHANEGAATGQLATRLSALDASLRVLKEQLGPVWRSTVVLLATEFGRTAAINGTRGTDHGTGAAAFLVGGAVQGGRVLADWPGLAERNLYQQRDLKPTTDLRSILKGALSEHMRVADGALAGAIFPESASARPISGLIRT